MLRKVVAMEQTAALLQGYGDELPQQTAWLRGESPLDGHLAGNSGTRPMGKQTHGAGSISSTVFACRDFWGPHSKWRRSPHRPVGRASLRRGFLDRWEVGPCPVPALTTSNSLTLLASSQTRSCSCRKTRAEQGRVARCQLVGRQDDGAPSHYCVADSDRGVCRCKDQQHRGSRRWHGKQQRRHLFQARHLAGADTA